MEFLDTQAFFNSILGSTEKSLATKVYFKETDGHTLLFKSSYHPQYTYRGLIYIPLPHHLILILNHQQGDA